MPEPGPTKEHREKAIERLRSFAQRQVHGPLRSLMHDAANIIEAWPRASKPRVRKKAAAK
jgi:hypothetical protein